MKPKLKWFGKLMRKLKRWFGLNDPDARELLPCGSLGADDCHNGDRVDRGVFAI